MLVNEIDTPRGIAEQFSLSPGDIDPSAEFVTRFVQFSTEG